MNGTLYLELLPRPGLALPANPRLLLGERPLRLGRAPDNDLVLGEETVSSHHATVGVARGAVRVRDHESTNGTWVDDVRVDGEAEIRSGQVLRLGLATWLRLGSTVPGSLVAPSWRLEVIETGAGVAIPPAGLRVGMGPAVDLSLALEGGGVFTVFPRAGGGEVTADGQERVVPPGVAFAVGGLHFRILPAEGPSIPTVGARSKTDGYRLRVVLDGPTGAEAVLQDPEHGLACRVTTENRAVLLYVLAARMVEDRAAHVPAERQGWCSDEEVATGIWGREAGRIQANNLNVLLHRLRRELEEAGFDTSFLEKKQRALRARLVHLSTG